VGLIGVSFTPFTALLPALSTSLIWFVVFFLVGFVAIAAMFAAAGALASRTEDLQNTTLPLTMLLMGTFFATFMADGRFERVLSYIPPASIVSMPQRILGGDAAWWEPLAALAILLAATAGTVLLCERAYRGALMQTGGGRVTWRAALTSAER
jgi:ABC-2 type transport system permease protein